MSTITMILQVSQEVQSDARAIADGSSELAQRAESQAASLEETSATMEEMAATVRSNAESAVNANETSSVAHHRATEGSAVTRNAVDARTAPEGTAATYSAAGWVRRNLEAAGFDTRKIPGPLGKRDMTIAALRPADQASTCKTKADD